MSRHAEYNGFTVFVDRQVLESDLWAWTICDDELKMLDYDFGFLSADAAEQDARHTIDEWLMDQHRSDFEPIEEDDYILDAM